MSCGDVHGDFSWKIQENGGLSIGKPMNENRGLSSGQRAKTTNWNITMLLDRENSDGQKLGIGFPILITAVLVSRLYTVIIK